MLFRNKVIHSFINNNVFLTLIMYIYDWSRERSQVVTIDGTIGHLSPPLIGTITHPIVASDCKWRTWEASPIGRTTSWNSL